MNKKRRILLASAKSMLESAASLIERISEEESDSMDNMPENLQESERYGKMEQAVLNLDEAVEHIEDAIDKIGDAIT